MWIPLRSVRKASLNWGSARLHETALVLLQYQAGQPVRCISRSVDPDPIGTNFRIGRRCVSVHDQFAILSAAGENGVPDIQDTPAFLPVKRHAGPSPRMAEIVIANAS